GWSTRRVHGLRHVGRFADSGHRRTVVHGTECESEVRPRDGRAGFGKSLGTGRCGGVSHLFHTADGCAWRIVNSFAFPGFRSLVTIVQCATWLSWLSTSWRLSPSPVREGRVPWWRIPSSSSSSCLFSNIVGCSRPRCGRSRARRAQSGGHRGRRRHETAESNMALSANRATDHVGLRHFHEQGCGPAHSRCSVPFETGRFRAVLAYGPGAR